MRSGLIHRRRSEKINEYKPPTYTMLKGEIEKLNLKKNLKKDQIQPGLIP
jgi:hypothetical protein